eukprot:COSAG05_NODE_1121_length_5808_cov_2.774391_12_plen_102_part_00
MFWGLAQDADLILLAMASHEPHFFVIREVLPPSKKQQRFLKRQVPSILPVPSAHLVPPCLEFTTRAQRLFHGISTISYKLRTDFSPNLRLGFTIGTLQIFL